MALFWTLLLFPTLALASSDMVSISELRQQVEAMGRWTKTYEAYGRTIEVDVPIIVPEVEKMPIVMIEPWRPYDEESWLPHQKIVETQELGGDDNPIFLRCGDVGVYSYLNPNSDQERTTRFYRFKYPKDDAENRTSQDYIQVRFNSASVMLNANGKELERTGKSYDYREMDSEMCYAEDSNVSVGEAEKCLRDILTYYYGEEGSDIEIDYVRVYQKEKKIVSGKVWRDTEGNVINAHGGGVLYHEGKYYWFGEHRPESGFVTEKGINCYSSTDLLNWNYEGVVLPISEAKGSDIEKGCIMERPKVIYNKQTGKFVMWFHLELKGRGYGPARAAVAVSDSPTGPYCFIRSARVNSSIYPLNMTKKEKRIKWNLSEYEKWWTPEWYDAVEKGMFVKRDLEGGQMSRDMTLFVDDDGKAYHIYSSEDNLTLQIAELSDDYLSHTGKYIRIFPGGHNEAPAIFKKDGIYWMITSGCTGWEPNKARLLTATSILGEWKQLPNPCVGENADKTFGGQSTYVLPLQGTEKQFIFMADSWRPESLADSRYIWLPVRFDEKGIPFIEWVDRWKPD